ncbi:bifunctional metallophosphatase/5'-nucleotidase [Vibrio agarivorans]|uniref:bifunctional metallophosphatase/5'-nucleotidase n=1 Tax=Vibrio agarivorans TaxID=153622 RepID=UPI00222E5317|nr:bifunctional metallophosphatase/5'-nucleotidase [Vibrio agarivorans]MDN3663191.1 bifunctional metallophosphatase/5'-nucleotidase [Vibrio agarivorans]
MKKSLLVTAVALGLAGCNSSSDPVYIAPNETFDISIAHINDTHSSFDEVKSSFTNDYLLQGKPVYTSFGGHPRLLSAANQYREQAEREDVSMLFLHGGDAWQGSAYFKLNKGQMNADILSRMGLDAMAMGNHEFDLDNETLASFLNTINFPVLGANMDVSSDEHLNSANNLHPYVLFSFDGNNKERVSINNLPSNKHVVAVIGVVLEDMPSISPEVGDVTFLEEVATTQKIVDDLKAKGINKIVLLTHLGLARDINIAENVNGVDVIVGGHSHTLMGDFTELGWEKEADYAQLVNNPDGGITCIVQAGEKAQAIGHANVQFDESGNIASCDGGNTLLSSDKFYSDNLREEGLEQGDEYAVKGFVAEHDFIEITVEEAELRSHIDKVYKPELEEAYGDVITYVPEELVHERRPNDGVTDEHGSQVAPMVGEGWLYWANQQEVLAATGFETVDIALVGAGGVRNSLEQGDLREGHISLELLPFSNYLSVLELTGAQIRQLIEETVTTSLKDTEHMGKFPYVAGMRYTFDETVAQTSGELSVFQVQMEGLDGDIEWIDIKDNSTYVVTTTNYNANGNDSWDALFDAQEGGVTRFDVVVDGDSVKAFEVERVEKSGDSITAIYANGMAPDCSDESTLTCNTDALAVIEYFDTEKDILEPQVIPTVTLNLLERD